MNRGKWLFAALLLLVACSPETKREEATEEETPVESREASREEKSDADKQTAEIDPDQRIEALVSAYPDFISEVKDNKVIFKDGSTIVYDDGKEKSFEVMLDNSDVEDMFSIDYNISHGTPDYLADAGRSRCEQLFKKMYGASAAEVSKKLVAVDWFGESIKFTGVNGAAEQLKRVAAEIKQHPELTKYMACSGTFYWRQVRGANRQSAHSYGIAIDIAVANSDYWLWKNPNAKETDKIKYANKIPLEIVEIFEKHNFIWGGAWYHYDTMHFEYRPEILNYARAQR